MAERREVHYSGRVQGVGFRFTTQEIANQYPVTGFVENLPDGRVRLVAEGSPMVLDEFLQNLASRMRGKIDRSTENRQVANGEFVDFRIRH